MDILVSNFNRAAAPLGVELDQRARKLYVQAADHHFDVCVDEYPTLLNPERARRLCRPQPTQRDRKTIRAFFGSTPEGRRLMRQAALPYLDQWGNLYLPRHVDGRSVLYFERPDSFDRVTPVPGAYTKTETRVLFGYITLPTGPGATGYQTALAHYVGVSEATVSRALNKLEGNGYPRERGALLPEQLTTLIRQWSEDYRLKLKPGLAHERYRPIGAPQDWRHLRPLPPAYTYSGVAASAVSGYDLVAGHEIEVYGPLGSVASDRSALRWAPDPNGLLVCRETFWSEGRIRRLGNTQPTIPLLTFADLLDARQARAIALAEEEVLDLCVQAYTF